MEKKQDLLTEKSKNSNETNSGKENDNVETPKNQPVMSVSEYAESFRWWCYQQQCIHQMNMASYQFFYNLHLFATCNYFNQLRVTQSPTTPSTAASNQNAQRPENNAGRECTIPALWMRLTAEMIDFLILFMLKLFIMLFIMDNTILLGPLEEDMERFFSVQWSPDNAMKMVLHLMALEFINRVFISVFEALSLRQGTRGLIGGSTPGKRMMGLRVVYCERVVSVPSSPDRVVVIPASDLMFPRALLRSLFKNFSLIIFPIFLTSFIFEHNRSLYDLLSSSLVIHVTDLHAHNFRH